MNEQQTTTQQPWPEGVLFRYLTIVGATVDLRRAAHDPAGLQGDCTGCGNTVGPDLPYLTKQAAQAHAEQCRALQRPEVTA